jgi:hypothetical protein
MEIAIAIFAGTILVNEGMFWGAVILGRPFIESLNLNNNTSSTFQVVYTLDYMDRITFSYAVI